MFRINKAFHTLSYQKCKKVKIVKKKNMDITEIQSEIKENEKTLNNLSDGKILKYSMSHKYAFFLKIFNKVKIQIKSKTAY